MTQPRNVEDQCYSNGRRLYFITMPQNLTPKSNLDYHFFCIDDELVYLNYYSDFGPLNLGALYRYCVKLNTKLNYYASGKKRVVHYTTIDPNKRANAAFLIAGYAIIYLKSTPTQAYQPLLTERAQPFRPFQDASLGHSMYTITLYQCIEGLFKALRYGFFDFNDFDLDDYERHEKIQHGDMTWIVPEKLIAFSGPCSFYKPPKYYVDYFLTNQVTAVVRLNKKCYEARRYSKYDSAFDNKPGGVPFPPKWAQQLVSSEILAVTLANTHLSSDITRYLLFTKVGIAHYELYMADGSIPSKHITQKFLKICENTPGGVAVHCKVSGRGNGCLGKRVDGVSVLSQSVADLVFTYTNAKYSWDKLVSLYEQSRIQRLSLLMTEFFKLERDLNMEIAAYVAKVENLFADMNTELRQRVSHDIPVELLRGQTLVTVGHGYQEFSNVWEYLDDNKQIQ
uniref:Dual specificity/tyrosine protein phosphatase N-terminal domain-containing protein n=1 Tax=Timema genevievae TaxID=629358 RepID=A0A7R9K3N7_TIMGE|nr:unnamed protein product [Timema genevievae]